VVESHLIPTLIGSVLSSHPKQATFAFKRISFVAPALILHEKEHSDTIDVSRLEDQLCTCRKEAARDASL